MVAAPGGSTPRSIVQSTGGAQGFGLEWRTDLEAFGNLDVVKILQAGFAGFGILLAFLAFRIIAAEQKAMVPSQEILASAHRFMAFALAMAVLLIVATIMERPPAGDRGAYLLGTVEDKSGPLQGVKVSLVRSASKRVGATSAALAVSPPASSVVTDLTDQMGRFDLGEVQFGSPTDHYRLVFEASRHRPQSFTLGPSGALTVMTYMAPMTETGDGS